MVDQKFVDRARRWCEAGNGNVVVAEYTRLAAPQEVIDAVPPNQDNGNQFYIARITDAAGVAAAFSYDDFPAADQQFVDVTQAQGGQAERAQVGKDDNPGKQV